MIHKDYVHHFNKISSWVMFKAVLPFLFVNVIIMPLQPITDSFYFKFVNILMLHKRLLLATRSTQDACKSDINNLLQLSKTK